MPGYPPDSRSLNLRAISMSRNARCLCMSRYCGLGLRSGRCQPQTLDGVAAMLASSRQLFVDGYYTHQKFMDAATRSLRAVDAALRVHFSAGSKVGFAQPIDKAQAEGRH